MNRPGFRRASRGGFAAGADGGKTSEPSDSGAPFSHAQILHLMKGEFSRARRHGYPLACVLMRIQGMAELSERHGHAFREDARHRLGALVADQTRDHDHLGLLREDSFLLLLPHTDGEAAMQVTARIVATFSEMSFQPDGAPLQLRVNMGIAACADKDTLFFDTLVSQAELALGQAELPGAGPVELFRRERFYEQ